MILTEIFFSRNFSISIKTKNFDFDKKRTRHFVKSRNYFTKKSHEILHFSSNKTKRNETEQNFIKMEVFWKQRGLECFILLIFYWILLKFLRDFNFTEMAKFRTELGMLRGKACCLGSSAAVPSAYQTESCVCRCSCTPSATHGTPNSNWLSPA